MNCSKCNSHLSPQKRRCPGCGSVQSPWFNRVLPWILGSYAAIALIMGTYGGIRENELGQALAVMIPLSTLGVGTAFALFRGATAGWHLLTVLLGLGTFGCMAAFITVDAGLSAGIFILSTVIYTGVVWRTASPNKWRIASFSYAAVTALASLFAFTKAERLGSAIGITLFAVVIATLIVWTYSVKIRWWYHIRLGWSGPYLGESEQETKD